MAKELISEVLKKARDFEKAHENDVPESERPVFHMASPIGWINDPNGFSEYNGKYHLFFQYHPYSTVWGPMHWGHCVSEDFVKWEPLPAALAPDEIYDHMGCFSGSALSYGGKHVLIYTGVSEAGQRQCIAFGDGETYEKYDGNPVILPEGLPDGSSKEDFRDPKLFMAGGKYYCIIGNKNDKTGGQAVLYMSDDLKTWSFLAAADESRHELGTMWECPDFFSVDDEDCIMASPMELERKKGSPFHGGGNSIFLTGKLEASGHFSRFDCGIADSGLDFYAPQSMETSDGRRIMTAWMHTWDNVLCPKDFLWNGQMTFPRELHIRDHKVYQKPVREIEDHYCDPVDAEVMLHDERKVVDGLSGRVFDMVVRTSGAIKNYTIGLAAGKDHETTVTVDCVHHTLTFDRSYSGLTKDCLNIRTVDLSDTDEIRILADRYSVEIFADEGRVAMTSLIFTPAEEDGIFFEAEGEGTLMIKKHGIR